MKNIGSCPPQALLDGKVGWQKYGHEVVETFKYRKEVEFL